MLTSEFNYNLPTKLIAQNPAEKRDHSRLMIIDRQNETIEHKMFFELPNLLKPNDLLVFNESKVLPARLYGKIKNKLCEILLIKEETPNTWEIMAKPGKKFKIGLIIEFFNRDTGEESIFSGEIKKIFPDGTRLIKFNKSGNDLKNMIHKYGKMPLPPYIKNSTAEDSRYQTVYAKNSGSIAAPTAGLHFTPEIFSKLSKKNIQTEYLTLHVGRGTFEPVKTENIKEHKMHNEKINLSIKSTETINRAKSDKHRIIAVGTTVVRSLESCVNPKSKKLIPQNKQTDIFIYPGYKFQIIDGLITNFHLPKSTLLMLVSAFAGKNLIFKAYEEAIKEKYRFFSFGDAMLIL